MIGAGAQYGAEQAAARAARRAGTAAGRRSRGAISRHPWITGALVAVVAWNALGPGASAQPGQDEGDPFVDAAAIAAMCAATPAQCAPAPAPAGKPPATKGGLATVHAYPGSITVAASIAPQVQRLLNDAHAAGVDLGGWGARTPGDQLRLRRAHCGTSNYATYDMPASQCSPPTARPGQSMHEKGLAIDFTCGGLTVSEPTACWSWLHAHAAGYGLKPLASEPWHWSTSGK